MAFQEKKEESQDSSFRMAPPPIPQAAQTQKNKKWIEQGILILLVLLVFFVFGYHCPIYRFTHIHCPGCGMTRAAFALVQGNISASISWHALLIPTLVLALLYLGFHQKYPKIGPWIEWTWVILMLVYWVYRLIYVFPTW